VFAGPETGASAATFADAIERGYGSLAAGSRLRVVKGHSVQVSTPETTVAAELLRPQGDRRPGYALGNVDAIHEFSGLDYPTMARIAALHALNDCYAYGGHAERAVRPLVAAPTDDVPGTRAVRAWFREGLPDIDLLAPTVVAHAGEEWLFGATATGEITHTPPVHTGRLEPDDRVLLHRPLGAVAALAAARNGHADERVRERAVAALGHDHVAVAEVIADECPPAGDPFDPDRHLKLATDVSGPGVGGVADLVARGGHRLHVDALPLLDREAVRSARDRWLLPDATLGTNGPVALIGRPSVIERVAGRLRREGATPKPLGRVVAGPGRLSTEPGIDLERLIEDRQLGRPAAGGGG
jgi:hypothetical protein